MHIRNSLFISSGFLFSQEEIVIIQKKWNKLQKKHAISIIIDYKTLV